MRNTLENVDIRYSKLVYKMQPIILNTYSYLSSDKLLYLTVLNTPKYLLKGESHGTRTKRTYIVTRDKK